MKIDFSDYITITENDVLEITREGIKYTGGFIDFSECAANFKEEHGGSGKCVAERDITGSNPSFGFYTAPLTTHIFFIPKGKPSEISKSSTYKRFYDLQKQIIEYGYTTRDYGLAGGAKMLLTNYDLYDIYSVICFIRFNPMAMGNAEIVQTLMNVINTEQIDNCIIDNAVRRRLTSERFSDSEQWKWMQTFNTYSYGARVIKDKEKYMVLFSLLSELSDCILSQDRERTFDCADALHNVPIILADETKHIKKRVLSEIKHYSRKWNALTYDAIKIIKF